MKKVDFHNSVKKIIREFPKSVRLSLGKAIFAMQTGQKLKMPLARMMKDIGKGVEEIRIKDTSGIYRIFYFTRLQNAILIFHAFKKKTQKTPKKEIDLGRKRLKEMLNGYE